MQQGARAPQRNREATASVTTEGIDGGVAVASHYRPRTWR